MERFEVPIYTGDDKGVDLEYWIGWMENYFAWDGDFTEDQKLQMAWGFLYNEAADWLIDLEKKTQYFETWASLKKALRSFRFQSSWKELETNLNAIFQESRKKLVALLNKVPHKSMANNASDATSVITSEETNDEASDVQAVLAEIPQMETTPFTHVLCQKEASNSYEMGEKNVVLSDVEDTSGNQNAHQVFDKISMSVNSQQQSQHVELGKPLEDSRNQATESAHHLPNEAHLRKQCKKRCLKSWKFKFKDDGGKKKRMRHSKVESWKRILSLLKKEDELKTAYLKKIEEMAVMNGSSADDVTNLQIISKEHKELILSTGASGFMMGERAHLLLMTKTTLKSCIEMLARVHTNSAHEVRLSNWERLIRYSVLPSLNMDNNGIVSLSAHEIAIGWYDAKGETENWEEAQVSKEGSIQNKVSNFLLEPCLNILSQQSLRSWKFKFQSCNLLEATCVKLEWRYNGGAIHGKLVRHGIVSNEYSSYGVSSYGGAGVLITDFSGKENCKDSAWMVQKLAQLHIFNISEVAPSDEKSPNVKNNTVSYQVFNRILHKEHNFQQKRTKVKGFKSWKFTFKSSYEEELFQHQWRMKQRDVHSRSVCAHKLQFLLLVLEDKLFFNRRSSVKFLREYFKKFNRETEVTIHYQPCKHARTEIQDVFGSLPRPPEGFGSEKAAQTATGKHHVLKHRLRVQVHNEWKGRSLKDWMFKYKQEPTEKEYKRIFVFDASG